MLFTCTHPNCSASFYTKQELRSHVVAHETRDFACTECSATFKSRNNLLKHGRIHDEARRYPCPFDDCGKKFSHKSNLKRHIRIHKGTKDFKCEVCSKSFMTRSNLTQHSAVHKTDKTEKNYRCLSADCSATFLYFSSLKKHMKCFHRTAYDAIYTPSPVPLPAPEKKEKKMAFSFDFTDIKNLSSGNGIATASTCAGSPPVEPSSLDNPQAEVEEVPMEEEPQLFFFNDFRLPRRRQEVENELLTSQQDPLGELFGADRFLGEVSPYSSMGGLQCDIFGEEPSLLC